MINFLFAAVKIIATSIGVGLLNHKFLTTSPTPPGLITTIIRHPMFPVVSGTLLNKPELVLRPLTKTSNSLVHLADKTGKILWEEENSQRKTKKSSLTELSNLFWVGLDELICFGIKKPKILGFLIIGSTLSYLVLEPSFNAFLENRRLQVLQRRLRVKIKEEQILRTIKEELNNQNREDSPLLSELIQKLENSGETKTLNSELAYLSNEDHFVQREAILKALKAFKK